jgi:hypothetical protein
MEEKEVVTGSESTTEETAVAEPTATTESTSETPEKENRIPISRAEEMYRKRLEKARSEWTEKELNPLRTKMTEYEKTLGQVAKGQIEFGRALGVIPKEEAPKPLTQADFEKQLNERLADVNKQNLERYHQERINNGWQQVMAKYPKIAGNKWLHNAFFNSYAENPDMPVLQHVDLIVKELLDPYATERGAALQKEKEKQLSPANRVVPGGRGGAGGSGNKDEVKKGVAQRVADALRARKEG